MDKSRKYLIDLQKSDPENRKCVDCSSMATFIDLKYGSFVCTRCAGLHRELGTDYCVIKSISLDNITKEQLKVFEHTKGNAFVNLVYEALDPREVKRLKPNQESTPEFTREFIRRKYKIRQFYKQYVPPKVEQPVKPKEPTIVPDMINFSDPIIVSHQQIVQPQVMQQPPQVMQQPPQVMQQPPQVMQPQIIQQPPQVIQQPVLTQKQQDEIAYKNKVNNVMNMFNY
jgi:hypothetical protein